MNFKRTNLKILIFLLFFQFLSAEEYSSSYPFELSLKTDISLLSAGVLITSGAYFYSKENRYKLSDEDIASLNRNEINLFDRSATYNYSENADFASDIGSYSLFTLPFFFMIDEKNRENFAVIPVMYLETMMFSVSINNFVKSYVKRKRPYIYNPEVSDDEKKSFSANRSFYSGHTTNSFAAASFFSYVFNELYPNSSFTPFIYGLSFSAAAGVGALRYFSGQHYPTDILTGAFVGILCGFSIPYLHKKNIEINTVIIDDGFMFMITKKSLTFFSF